ncbi:MAG: maleylpyruvate isomerase N-terminal domain-containing protein [Dehalococcoidia bacterium]|nr:maleylpyruvate isomerase N-terminal domain-containing protein [Dehalococcoidia bacterium]
MSAEPEPAATPLPLAVAAVEDLRLAHRELLRVVDSLSDDGWERPVPYGEWTVKDLVAHAIGDMSPSGPGLILAGVLTPQFIADTSSSFDLRARNRSLVEERRRYTKEDLRQLLFEAHDAMIAATLKLDERHLPVLAYTVPMGPGYDLRVEDWLWHGYHDRQHADDIRRALEVDYTPAQLAFLPEVEDRLRMFVRTQDGFLRAVYSVADDAWDEEAPACPGWTYGDILAHVAANETRLQVRLRAARGEASRAELDAVNDVDAWNHAAVTARRGRSPAALAGEFLAGRHATLQELAGFRPPQLSGTVALAGGEEVPVLDFIDRISRHTSVHAGQLVPASSARRPQTP